MDRYDRLIQAVKDNMQSYYCKWCKRHLKNEGTGGFVFVHDDVYHPPDYSPECGGEHILH